MTDRRRTYTSSVMAAKTSGASPDKRRRYDEAFKAEALYYSVELNSGCIHLAGQLMLVSTRSSGQLAETRALISGK
jgi:hypothetical protein